MKKIVILINTTSNNALSYCETLDAIKSGDKRIVTNCLDFACFHYLKNGYEVEIVKYVENYKFDYKYIVLSELLENNRPYVPSQKEIRYAHNVQKMLKGGTLKFLSSKELSFDVFKEEVAEWHKTPSEKRSEIHEYLGLSLEEYNEKFKYTMS